jgi:hypothetical protein
MTTELAEPVTSAVIEIEYTVEKMLAELPQNTDLEAVTVELIQAIGSACPRMRKIVIEFLAARRALIELGISLDDGSTSLT